jgi:hypothetical protein
MELGPGEARQVQRPRLASLSPKALFAPREVVDREMAECCLAGLWLWQGFLDESHRISQSIASPSGSYWHGIMHRREPDFGNAKYWFRQVGAHPIHDSLLHRAQGIRRPDRNPSVENFIGQKAWDARAFVDLCQEAIEQGRAVGWCSQVASLEWQLLFDHCYRNAVGQTGAEAPPG